MEGGSDAPNRQRGDASSSGASSSADAPAVEAFDGDGQPLVRQTIVAPFEDQFADVDGDTKVFWQFTVPKLWKDGDIVRVVLPSKLELAFVPPAGTRPLTPLAFLVPRAETLQRESASDPRGKGLARKAADGAVNLARKVSFGRKPSFSRRPSRKSASSEGADTPRAHAPSAAPVFIEVDLFKKDVDVPLGLSLSGMGRGHAPRDGVVVAKVTSDGLVGRSKKVFEGDMLHAVNGIKVDAHNVAAGLLQSAKGVVQCVVTRAEALPNGWERRDDGKNDPAKGQHKVYYVQKPQARWSYSHPLAIDRDATGTYVGVSGAESEGPPTCAPEPGSSDDGGGGGKTYRDGIEYMSTRALMVELVQDETSGALRSGEKRRGSAQLETTSL